MPFRDTDAVFQEKLNNDYLHMLAEWLKLDPFELITKAEEIYATALVLGMLPTVATTEQKSHLIWIKNPLEEVRDRWIEENGFEMVHAEDVRRAVWLVAQNLGAEPEPAQRGPEMC